MDNLKQAMDDLTINDISDLSSDSANGSYDDNSEGELVLSSSEEIVVPTPYDMPALVEGSVPAKNTSSSTEDVPTLPTMSTSVSTEESDSESSDTKNMVISDEDSSSEVPVSSWWCLII